MKQRVVSAIVIASAVLMVSCGGGAPKKEPKKEEVQVEEVKEEEKVEEPVVEETAQVVDEEAVTRGSETFNTQCIACHTLDKKGIGPALGDVTTRRTDEWIIKMIVDPTDMLENDPDAKALLEEYNNVPMAPLGIDEAGAKDILAYLKSAQ